MQIEELYTGLLIKVTWNNKELKNLLCLYDDGVEVHTYIPVENKICTVSRNLVSLSYDELSEFKELAGTAEDLLNFDIDFDISETLSDDNPLKNVIKLADFTKKKK